MRQYSISLVGIDAGTHWGTNESREETEDEDRGDVLGEDAGDLEDDEETQSDDVDGVATDEGDLLDRCEDHGPHSVCEDEEGD
jgi:hypothetical protein